jgi:hypothetical protein
MLIHLYTAALVAVVAGSSCAMLDAGGIFLFALVCILAVLLNQAESVFRAIVYFLGLLFVLAMLLPAISVAREGARRATCGNNLRQLALALHNYHDRYGCFPPAYVADKDGKPVHSWRVLILPFMECRPLYERYDFNEPWNGPHNRKLLAERPSELACLSDENARARGSTHTNYLAVMGTRTAWRGDKPRSTRDADLAGKSASTIMLVEVADANINWTEPKDLSIDVFQNGDSPSMRVVPSSRHLLDNGFFYYDTPIVCAAMMDGSLRLLPADRLATGDLLTIGGCPPEIVNQQNLQLNWLHCTALPIWIIAVALLLIRAVRSR